jgi:hypothetical protein
MSKRLVLPLDREATDAVPPGLPALLDKDAARKAISERYFPITMGTLERELAHLPSIKVGRNALFETASVLKVAEQLLQRSCDAVA